MNILKQKRSLFTPKEAPHGRFIHLGAIFNCCTIWVVWCCSAVTGGTVGPAPVAESTPNESIILLDVWCTTLYLPPIRLYTLTWPSNEDAHIKSGFRLHQAKSKHHWPLVGNSYTISPFTSVLFGFQQMMRLSLAELTSKFESTEHHVNANMPLWWPSRIRTGDVANLIGVLENY